MPFPPKYVFEVTCTYDEVFEFVEDAAYDAVVEIEELNDLDAYDAEMLYDPPEIIVPPVPIPYEAAHTEILSAVNSPREL
jgi:hypothetical protein